MTKFRDMQEQGTFHAGREYERKIQAKRIEELEAGQLDFAKEMAKIHKGKRQRIKELEAENKKMKELKCPPIESGDTCICPIEEQAKRIKELEELLIEYGRHSAGCNRELDDKYSCRCGWDREKKALKG